MSKAACGIEYENPLTRTESVGFRCRTIETVVGPRGAPPGWPSSVDPAPNPRLPKDFKSTSESPQSCKDKPDAQLFLTLVLPSIVTTIQLLMVPESVKTSHP